MNKKRFGLKGIIVVMTVLSAILGLLGCSNRNNYDDSFGYEGSDFSEAGPGEYKKIVGFNYNVGGFGPNYAYTVQRSEEDNKYIFECADYENSIKNVRGEVDEELLLDFSQLCADLNVISWDKFDMVAKNVLDGEGFYLTITYEDGTKIHAEGENAFPKNYSEFKSGVAEIFDPSVEEAIVNTREEMYKDGLYLTIPQYVGIYYTQKGDSGSDSYSFSVEEETDGVKNVSLEINSVSGEFLEPGEYEYHGETDNSDEIVAKIQEVLEKYKVYKWDGYSEYSGDYNNREDFMFYIRYPETEINCSGCGDLENYDEIRTELLGIIADSMKKYL